MSGRNVVEALNLLFDQATGRFPVRDGGSHLLVDPALYLSRGDIENSSLSPELQAMLTQGFNENAGELQLKFIRHLPEPPQNRGQMTMELSGRRTRIGGEVIVQYDHTGEPFNIKAVPPTKMMVLYGFGTNVMEVISQFAKRPEATHQQDALALVALARKAIGLSAE